MYARRLQQILFDISENGFVLTIENAGYIHDTIRIMISKSYKHAARSVTKDELNMSNIDNDLHIRIVLEDLLKEMKKVCTEVTRPSSLGTNEEKKYMTDTIDVQPVVHGEWIDGGVDGVGACDIEYRYNKCSVCGYEYSFPMKYNFCPNCGAKMDGGE